MIKRRKKLYIYLLGSTPIRNRTDVFIMACQRLCDKVVYSESKTNKNRLWRLLWDLTSIVKCDIVYIQAGNNAASSSLPVKIARFLSKIIIAEVYISSYETEVLDRKRVSSGSKAAERLKQIDRGMLQSDYTIFMTNAELKKYNRLAGYDGSQTKGYVIPLSTDPRDRALLSYWNRDSHTCNIVWWGTYIPLHGLNNIIEGAKMLHDRRQDFHLYLLGNSEKQSQIYKEKIISIEASEYITIINDYSTANGKLMPFIIENCDIALGALGDTDKARTVVPNKVLEAISMHIPLLNRKSEAMEEFYTEQSQTVFYCESEPQSIADKLHEIMQTPSKSIIVRTEKANEIFNKYNNKSEAGVNYYVKLLEDVIDDAKKKI